MFSGGTLFFQKEWSPLFFYSNIIVIFDRLPKIKKFM